jgi:hypothetical protein
MDARAGAVDEVGELGASVDDVLAVVEDHEDVLVPQNLEQQFDERSVRLLAKAEDAGNSRRHLRGLGSRGKVHEPDSFAAAIEQFSGDLQRQTCLAGAAGPGERHEARGLDQRADFGELGIATDKGAEKPGQIVGQLRVVERVKWREIGAETVRIELEDPLRPAEILQLVEAEVPENGAERERIAYQGRRRRRQHDLAPVGDGGDPSRSMNIQTDESGAHL